MAEATAEAAGLTRREFLYYIWGASLALFTLEFTGLMVWFMLPRFAEGEFGGTFTLPIDVLPDKNAPPFNFADGRFWLVNLDTNDPIGLDRMYLAPDEEPGPIVGAAAIYKVCTHLGCIYAWVPANNRYECPCHGSKYRLDGRRIEDPAPRTLDRFKLSALDEGGTVLASSEIVDGFYNPLILPANTALLQVDTGDKKLGPSEVLLCRYAGNCP
jgi:cytochrome b6-f complex iron-sulfur subunit